MSRGAFSYDPREAGDVRDTSARFSVRPRRPALPDIQDPRNQAAETPGRGESTDTQDPQSPRNRLILKENGLSIFLPGDSIPNRRARRGNPPALMRHVSRPSIPLRSTVLLCDIGERTIEEASSSRRGANTVKARLRRGRTKLAMAMRTSRVPANAPYDMLHQSDVY